MTARAVLMPSLLCLAVAPALALGAGDSARATCHGFPVTTTKSSGYITGTAHRDVIRLTARATVHAGPGNDIICGSRQADVIDAGPGDDAVFAGPGDDRIDGGRGRDRLYGEGGDDSFDTADRRAVIMGGPGRTALTRSAKRSTIASGTRAVSVMADMASLEDLMALRAGFLFSWVPDGQPDSALTPAWAFASPFLMTAMTANDDLRAFWSYSGTFGPGVAVPVAGSNPTRFGDTWVVVPHEQRNADLWLGGRQSGAGNVGFASQVESPSAAMAVGLSVGGFVSGSEFAPRPALALQLPAGASAHLSAPSRVRLDIGRDTDVGTLMAPSWATLTVDLAENSVVKVRYDRRGFHLEQ